MMYTMDDKTTAGEVVVVIRPHQGPSKVVSYVSVEDAFSSWRESAIYCEYKSFDDFKDSLQDDDAIRHDAYQAQIFLAEGQSYRDYISEIYDGTRGHAQPSFGQIRRALYVAEESEEVANE